MAKRNLADHGSYAYTDPVVIRAPSHFPDGDFSLIVEGDVLAVNHRGVLWTVRTERFGERAGTPNPLMVSAAASEPQRLPQSPAKRRKRAKAQTSAGSATG
ncbi:MAG TPA: hypothetical protein VG225_10585 [Terracidiphilus sp.]|nr:hypothetical protein [Terracidiphilus sp.]